MLYTALLWFKISMHFVPRDSSDKCPTTKGYPTCLLAKLWSRGMAACLGDVISLC
jgi:hypothetical protein